MNEIKQYVAFNPGLIMKTHYLTEPMAYFLGGIMLRKNKLFLPMVNIKLLQFAITTTPQRIWRLLNTMSLSKKLHCL